MSKTKNVLEIGSMFFPHVMREAMAIALGVAKAIHEEQGGPGGQPNLFSLSAPKGGWVRFRFEGGTVVRVHLFDLAGAPANWNSGGDVRQCWVCTGVEATFFSSNEQKKVTHRWEPAELIERDVCRPSRAKTQEECDLLLS